MHMKHFTHYPQGNHPYAFFASYTHILLTSKSASTHCMSQPRAHIVPLVWYRGSPSSIPTPLLLEKQDLLPYYHPASAFLLLPSIPHPSSFLSIALISKHMYSILPLPISHHIPTRVQPQSSPSLPKYLGRKCRPTNGVVLQHRQRPMRTRSNQGQVIAGHGH